MAPESKVLGATFDAFDSIDSDQGPKMMNQMRRTWPQDFRRRLPPRMQVPLNLMNRMAVTNLMSLKSWHWARRSTH